jgi:excisionase family DNA binding protein
MTALLTPAEVAALFRVDPKTVTRWAQEKKLSSVRTLGGHRRYRAAEIHALLNGSPSCWPDALQTLVDDHYGGDPLRALQDLADRYGITVTVLDRPRRPRAAASGPPDRPVAAEHRAGPAQLTLVYESPGTDGPLHAPDQAAPATSQDSSPERVSTQPSLSADGPLPAHPTIAAGATNA